MMKELDFAIVFVRRFSVSKQPPEKLPDAAHAHYSSYGLAFDKQRQALIADLWAMLQVKTPLLIERLEFDGWRTDFLESECKA